jgi:hypothetical protein
MDTLDTISIDLVPHEIDVEIEPDLQGGFTFYTYPELLEKLNVIYNPESTNADTRKAIFFLLNPTVQNSVRDANKNLRLSALGARDSAKFMTYAELRDYFKNTQVPNLITGSGEKLLATLNTKDSELLNALDGHADASRRMQRLILFMQLFLSQLKGAERFNQFDRMSTKIFSYLRGDGPINQEAINSLLPFLKESSTSASPAGAGFAAAIAKAAQQTIDAAGGGGGGAGGGVETGAGPSQPPSGAASTVGGSSVSSVRSQPGRGPGPLNRADARRRPKTPGQEAAEEITKDGLESLEKNLQQGAAGIDSAITLYETLSSRALRLIGIDLLNPENNSIRGQLEEEKRRLENLQLRAQALNYCLQLMHTIFPYTFGGAFIFIMICQLAYALYTREQKTNRLRRIATAISSDIASNRDLALGFAESIGSTAESIGSEVGSRAATAASGVANVASAAGGALSEALSTGTSYAASGVSSAASAAGGVLRDALTASASSASAAASSAVKSATSASEALVTYTEAEIQRAREQLQEEAKRVFSFSIGLGEIPYRTLQIAFTLSRQSGTLGDFGTSALSEFREEMNRKAFIDAVKERIPESYFFPYVQSPLQDEVGVTYQQIDNAMLSNFTNAYAIIDYAETFKPSASELYDQFNFNQSTPNQLKRFALTESLFSSPSPTTVNLSPNRSIARSAAGSSASLASTKSLPSSFSIGGVLPPLPSPSAALASLRSVIGLSSKPASAGPQPAVTPTAFLTPPRPAISSSDFGLSPSYEGESPIPIDSFLNGAAAGGGGGGEVAALREVLAPPPAAAAAEELAAAVGDGGGEEVAELREVLAPPPAAAAAEVLAPPPAAAAAEELAAAVGDGGGGEVAALGAALAPPPAAAAAEAPPPAAAAAGGGGGVGVAASFRELFGAPVAAAGVGGAAGAVAGALPENLLRLARETAEIAPSVLRGDELPERLERRLTDKLGKIRDQQDVFEAELGTRNLERGGVGGINPIELLTETLRTRAGVLRPDIKEVVVTGLERFGTVGRAFGERTGADYRGLQFIDSLNDPSEVHVFNIIRRFYGYGDVERGGYTGYSRTALDYQQFLDSIKYSPSATTTLMEKIDRFLGEPQNFFVKDVHGRQEVLRKVLFGIPEGQPGHVEKQFYYTPEELIKTSFY